MHQLRLRRAFTLHCSAYASNVRPQARLICPNGGQEIPRDLRCVRITDEREDIPFGRLTLSCPQCFPSPKELVTEETNGLQVLALRWSGMLRSLQDQKPRAWYNSVFEHRKRMWKVTQAQRTIRKSGSAPRMVNSGDQLTLLWIFRHG